MCKSVIFILKKEAMLISPSWTICIIILHNHQSISSAVVRNVTN
jgi:hypothetical protein